MKLLKLWNLEMQFWGRVMESRSAVFGFHSETHWKYGKIMKMGQNLDPR